MQRSRKAKLRVVIRATFTLHLAAQVRDELPGLALLWLNVWLTVEEVRSQQ